MSKLALEYVKNFVICLDLLLYFVLNLLLYFVLNSVSKSQSLFEAEF